MRVLFFTAEYPPAAGGIGMFAYSLRAGLSECGVEARVLAAGPAKGSQEPAEGTTRIPCRLSRPGVKLLAFLLYGLRLCLAYRPDWIVAMAWTYEGLAAYALKLLCGTPYVLVTHGSEIERHRGNPIARRWMLAVLRSAGVVVSNSADTRSRVCSLGFKASRVHVLHPCFRPLPAVEGPEALARLDEVFHLGGKTVLFTAARMVRRKGHELVLRAMPSLLPKYPEIVYVATGAGPYAASLRELAERLGVADRLRLTGEVDTRTLAALYHRAAIYVSPSIPTPGDIEGFGISFLEAASCGKPSIAGRSGGTAEAVVDGVTGYLVDGSNTEELIERLDQLLGDRALRDRLGAAGRRFAAGFTPALQAARLCALLTGGHGETEMHNMEQRQGAYR